MRKKNALILIDVQYDFTNPNGALFVDGAVEDCQRTADFILKNLNEIDYVATTLDSHQVNDIAHPSFWSDKDGKNPNPFTVITAQNVRDGVWTPRFTTVNKALEYLDALEKEGEFPHVIWPTHCLIASEGHAIDATVFKALVKYQQSGRACQFVTKGTHPMTEHFGAFMAQVPIPGRPETELNMGLLKTLSEYENVYLAGQAKSHCVATTLKQALKYLPELAKKIIVLEDCMSNVAGGPAPGVTFAELAQPIYDDAKKAGVRFAVSTQVNFGQSVNNHSLV